MRGISPWKGYPDCKVSKELKSTDLLGVSLVVCDSTFCHSVSGRQMRQDVRDGLTLGET